MAEEKKKGIPVRATKAGHYGGFYRHEGDEFEIADEKAFSTKWMVRLDQQAKVVPSEPDRPVKAKPTGDRSVI